MKKLKFQRPLISTVAFEEMFINGKSKEFGWTCLYNERLWSSMLSLLLLMSLDEGKERFKSWVAPWKSWQKALQRGRQRQDSPNLCVSLKLCYHIHISRNNICLYQEIVVDVAKSAIEDHRDDNKNVVDHGEGDDGEDDDALHYLW